MKTEHIIELLKIEYDKLADETKYALEKWINALNKSDNYNYNHTSYGLKHYFENAANILGKTFCVSNEQFKYAMYINGFEPETFGDDNWCFKIDEKQQFNW